MAEIVPARDFLAAGVVAASGVVPLAVVSAILEWALGRAETAENLRADPPRFDSKPFLKKLDVAETDLAAVNWTPGLVHRALSVYVGFTQEPAAQFTVGVRTDLGEQAEESARTVRRLEREEVAVVRLLEGRTARRQSAKLPPSDGRDERVAKYERHLHTLLTSTLHELERLQARREGEEVPPPAVADLNVTVDVASG